jgi:hypothetical protein
LFRRMRGGLAAIYGQPRAGSRSGRAQRACGHDTPTRRKPPSHLRRTPAVLLLWRHEARPDYVPKRVQLRRALARRQPQR